jgi:hypothetical protein
MTRMIFLGPSGELVDAPDCPGCGKTLDGFTPINNLSTPKDGDLTICVYCHTALVFQAGEGGALTLRRVTATEALALRARLGGGSL